MRILSSSSKATRLTMLDEAVRRLRNNPSSHMPPRVAGAIADFLEVFAEGEARSSHSASESDWALLLAATIVREVKS